MYLILIILKILKQQLRFCISFVLRYFTGSNSINHSSLPASLEHMYSTDHLRQHRLQSAGKNYY